MSILMLARIALGHGSRLAISLNAACEQAAEHPAVESSASEPLARLVLWFHHIKDLTKRKNIVGWANELDIRGFSKPGFPGVVICEGRKSDIQAGISLRCTWSKTNIGVSLLSD